MTHAVRRSAKFALYIDALKFKVSKSKFCLSAVGSNEFAAKMKIPYTLIALHLSTTLCVEVNLMYLLLILRLRRSNH